MNKLLASLILLLPVVSSASVLYDFNYPATRGSFGFSVITDNYITSDRTAFTAAQLRSCNTSGLSADWACTGAVLTSDLNAASGYVTATLYIVFTPDPNGGPGSTTSVTTGFPSARLTTDGLYQSFADPGSTLLVQSQTANAPEPATWSALLLGGALIGFAKLRRKRAQATV